MKCRGGKRGGASAVREWGNAQKVVHQFRVAEDVSHYCDCGYGEHAPTNGMEGRSIRGFEDGERANTRLRHLNIA